MEVVGAIQAEHESRRDWGACRRGHTCPADEGLLTQRPSIQSTAKPSSTLDTYHYRRGDSRSSKVQLASRFVALCSKVVLRS